MMDLQANKYVVYSAIIVLVLLVAFNFEKLTGYASKNDVPARITITNTLPGGDLISDRSVARLIVQNSFPNQRIRAYREDGRFVGYTFNTEDCKPVKASSSEYTCNAELYLSSRELEDGSSYYFQALDRKGNLEGNKAYFTFEG